MENNNKLIAEFMGINHLDDDKYIKNLKEMRLEGLYFEQGYMTSELKFDTDWNWLMKVVDKIESFHATIRLTSNFNHFQNKNYHQVTIEIAEGKLSECRKVFFEDGFIYKHHSNTGLNRIDCYYESVIEFIKLYNENK